MLIRVDEEGKEVQDDMANPESMQQLADKFMLDFSVSMTTSYLVREKFVAL